MSAPASRQSAAFRVVALDEVDSTNAEALRRAAAGERGPLWIQAHRQTRGRGRSGRGWISNSGNLTATLLLEPGCPPAALHELSLLARVAVWDGLRPLLRQVPAGNALRLKWPNDILLAGAKLGGILVESTMFGASTVAAIGIGINIVSAPPLADRDTASLADLGIRASAGDVLAAISTAMDKWLDTWRGGAGFAHVREAWLKRTGPQGEWMSVHAGAAPVTGRFVGLDEMGALLLSCATAGAENWVIRRFTFGDVSLLSTHEAEERK